VDLNSSAFALLLIAAQLCFLLLMSAGTGWWLCSWLYRGAPITLRRLILCAAAGLTLQVLFLSNLVYFDVPVRKTFWLPALVSIAGLAHAWKNRSLWLPLGRRDRSDLKWIAGVFLAVVLLQGITLIHQGPSNYYGIATHDHVNYVLIGQQVLERPLSTNSAGTEPWLLKPIVSKVYRLGQSVTHAYLSAGMFGDTKETFGGLCLYFLGLLSVMTFLAARLLGLGRWESAGAALWAGLAAGTFHIYAYGFLSQVTSLYVFPALFVAVRVRPRTMLDGVLPALLLAQVFACYTEFFPFAILTYACLQMIGPASTIPARGIALAYAAVFAIFAVPLYVPYALRFFKFHLTLLAAQPSPALEPFAPFGGTMYGWAREILAEYRLDAPAADTWVMRLGYLLLVLIASAFFTVSFRKRLWIAAIAAAPLLAHVFLTSKLPFSKYPVWKLHIQFAYLAALLAVLGLARLRTAAQRQWGTAASRIVTAAGAALVLFGISGGVWENVKLARLLPPYQTARFLQAPVARETLAKIEAAPGQTYVIAEQDLLGNMWLSYHMRRSAAYYIGQPLGDLGAEDTILPRLPETLDAQIVTIGNGISRDPDIAVPPVVQVQNPQGQDTDPVSGNIWYWMPETMNLSVRRYPSKRPPVEYDLVMKVSPGSGHPNPQRRLAFVNTATNERREFEFNAPTELKMTFSFIAGVNNIQVILASPESGFVSYPPDPRKLITRIENIQIRRKK